MNSPEPMATRREVDQIAGRLNQVEQRIDHLDATGTRGVAVIQSQMTNLTNKVDDLKTGIDAKFIEHNKDHELDQTRVDKNRRILFTTLVSVSLAVLGMFVTLLAVMLAQVTS